MVTREDVYAPGARLENSTAPVQASGPAHQVAGREIIVGLDCGEPLQRFVIAVDVGKNEQLQRLMIAPEAARVVPPAKKLKRLPRVRYARERIVRAVVLAGSLHGAQRRC